MKAPDEKEEALFREALQRAKGAVRDAFLDGACAGDQALRARLDALLRAHESSDPFLEPSGVPPGRTIALSIALTERPGDRIGRYKLLQQIGEGGCGVVYMAEQEQPIHRRVALKVIKLGMDTKQVIARFEAERQALALMDHPNIAKVLDAGATETGRPFFVMELVRGIKITDYCDQNHLSTEARLKLFVAICHAIQHAHQKGVIHRDIKPSNILVTLHDGVPVPKVIDFGIAKATDQRLTDKTLFTAFEQLIGTPAYMSPEQAEMSGLDVDTCSDIYALGVLLYELLTGQTPFDQKELVAAGLEEMRRIIREQEPARPSTRLSTLAAPEQTTVAQRRNSEPPQLIHLVRGDLDWIVMKCLEKDRTRRYETANALADDVTRHLVDEPVVARPPGRVYRLQKLVRRNKLVFAAASAVTAALMVGLGLATWLLFREQAAHRQAQAQARKSEQIARLLQDTFQGVGPSVALGRDTTMLKEILDRTAERLGKDLKDQAEIEAEMRSTLGWVYWNLGQYTNAESMFRTSLMLRRALWGNLNTNVADSLDGLAFALYYQDWASDQVDPLLREALNIRSNLLGAKHPKIADSLFNLGYVRIWPNRDPEAETFLRQSLAMRRKLLGNDNLEVARSLTHLSCVLSLQGRPAEAESVAREALAIQTRLPGSEPIYEAEIARLCLGIALFGQDKLDEAEPLLRQAVKSFRAFMGPEHMHAVLAVITLAGLLSNNGQPDEAEALAHEALGVSRKPGGTPNLTPFCLGTLGAALHKEGRLAEAESAFREALAALENSPVLSYDDYGTRTELITVLREQGHLTDIDSLYRAGVATQRKVAAKKARQREAWLLGDWANFLRDHGKAAEAEPLYRDGLALCRQYLASDVGLRQRLTDGLAGALKAQGKQAAAEAFYDAQEQPVRVAILRSWADLSGRHGQWKEAAADLERALDLDPSDAYPQLQLAAVLAQTGDLESYRTHCRMMMARFGGTDNPLNLDKAAKGSLLIPCAGPDLQKARQLAEKALTLGKDQVWVRFFQFCNGLAEYRLERYPSAVDSMLKTVRHPRRLPHPLQDWELDVAAYSVLAMAQHHLNQTDDARTAFAKALELAQTKLPQLGHDDLEQDWVDWVIAHVLLCEAKALVEGETTLTNRLKP